MVDGVDHLLDTSDQASNLIIFRIDQVVRKMFIQIPFLDRIGVFGQLP